MYPHTPVTMSTMLTLCFRVSPLQKQQEIRVFSRTCLLFIKMTQRKRERKRVGGKRHSKWWNKQGWYFQVVLDKLSSVTQLNMCFVSWLPLPVRSTVCSLPGFIRKKQSLHSFSILRSLIITQNQLNVNCFAILHNSPIKHKNYTVSQKY